MGDGNSLINLGDISKPATVLIEKISNAIGDFCHPYQIKRVARAEAEAEIQAKKIRMSGNFDIELTEIQQRSLVRLIAQQEKQQENIENITREALNDLNNDAHPENIEDDWLTNFFDKCKLVSDKEMQSLWAKILAGEANSPSSFSKRTIELVYVLDKTDAQLFTNLCTFRWLFSDIAILMFDEKHDIYKSKGITFNILQHLTYMNLIHFNSFVGFAVERCSKIATGSYYSTSIVIELPEQENNTLHVGKVMLTKAGQQLASICVPSKSDEFLEYALQQWQNLGYLVSSPLSINKV